MEKGITLERANELINLNTKPLGTEEISAADCDGRVAAEDICAGIDQPPFPRSPLDGYALRAADSASAPVSLRVVDTIYAGGWSDVEVHEGECVRLMTGAPIPHGCDCVIRQEDTDLGERVVRIEKALKPWQNYCFEGEDFKSGDVIIPRGTRLCGNALGVLASAGLCRDDVKIKVYKRLRCALICTGDELVPASVHPLPKGKIYSSNEAVIASRLKALGCEISLIKGEFSDDGAALAEAICSAAESCDAVITTGGVSVGVKDILHEALPTLGAERIFAGVRLKPGSPVMFSRFNGVPILSLSGNPFAASATFELLGRTMIAALTGCNDVLPVRCEAVLAEDFNKKGGRRFVRGHYADGQVAVPQRNSSGQLASAVGSNCLAEIPPSDTPLAKGAAVRVWLI